MLSVEGVDYLRQGQAVRPAGTAPDLGLVRIYGDSGDFLGVGEALADGGLRRVVCLMSIRLKRKENPAIRHINAL